MPRKAYPFQLMEATNDKQRLTKEQLRRRQEEQPEIESNKLVCPAHLSEDAKKEWKRITKLYKEFDNPILSDLDKNALEVYCEAVVTYRKALAKVRETSEVFVSKTDPNNPRKNPWLTVANEAAAQMKKYGEVLLLDPVSRARVGLAKSKQDDIDPMAEFIARRKGG